MEPAQVMKELGLTEHKLRFTSSVTMETTVPHHVFMERMQCELERYFIWLSLFPISGDPEKKYKTLKLRQRKRRQPKYSWNLYFSLQC